MFKLPDTDKPTPPHSLIHLPKTKKRPHPEPEFPVNDEKPVLNIPLEDPNLQCIICHWRYPGEYGEEDKHRHMTLARAGACQQDTDSYKQRTEAGKLARRLQDREKRMNGPGDRGVELKVCPHCGKSLVGSWGPFKQTHVEECAAKLLDKELKVIVEESALIPKKKREVSNDPYALTFQSLSRRH